MLGLMCLANPQRAVRYAVICTLASVAGGMLGYGIGFFLYESIGLALLGALGLTDAFPRSEEHTSELQSLMRISYAVFCLKKTYITATYDITEQPPYSLKSRIHNKK